MTGKPTQIMIRVWIATLMGIHMTAVAEDSPPNFVMFLADDMGYGDAACYGHPVIQTPNLDQFAKQGMKFTQCYSASSVCSPSRSAILTGRTPYRNGVFTWIPGGSHLHLRKSEITIATLLKKKGYDTCHVGKWHLNGKFNSPNQPQPNDHGYNHWLATQNNASPSHKNPSNFVLNGKPVGKTKGYSALLVADEGIRWLKKVRNKSKPFFLAVWTHEPHLPIESDPKFMDLYKQFKDEGIRQHHGNITQLDQAFGNLMKALDQLGLAENTFVFFTSDNGPEGRGNNGRTRGSTGGLRNRKRAVYEGGIRVPGIIRWPDKIKPGSVSHQPIIGSDFFTTVCKIANVQIPQDRVIDGVDITTAFTGGTVERKTPLYWRCNIAPGGVKVAMRIGDYKILAPEDFSRFEMYNIAKDEKETTNLALKEPEKFEEMKKAFISLNKEIETEGPDWWKNYGRRRKGRKVKGPRIGKGIDKTGHFDVVKGGTVTKSDLGYQITSTGEAFALKKLESTAAKSITFTLKYKTALKAGTRNACLVFGTSPTNNKLMKAGSMIGLSAHGIFEGAWNNLNNGSITRSKYDQAKAIEASVTIDLKKRVVTATIGKKTIKQKLPAEIKSIKYFGYYVKATTSYFSKITVRTDNKE